MILTNLHVMEVVTDDVVQLYGVRMDKRFSTLASRATFSRKKTAFEEMGLIETEKVSIDVGRPRQRLVLGDERLQGVDAGELMGVVRSITLLAGS